MTLRARHFRLTYTGLIGDAHGLGSGALGAASEAERAATSFLMSVFGAVMPGLECGGVSRSPAAVGRCKQLIGRC